MRGWPLLPRRGTALRSAAPESNSRKLSDGACQSLLRDVPALSLQGTVVANCPDLGSLVLMTLCLRRGIVRGVLPTDTACLSARGEEAIRPEAPYLSAPAAVEACVPTGSRSLRFATVHSSQKPQEALPLIFDKGTQHAVHSG